MYNRDVFYQESSGLLGLCYIGIRVHNFRTFKKNSTIFLIKHNKWQ